MRVIGATLANAFSGADDALFQELHSRRLLAGITDGHLPAAWKLFLLTKSFRLGKRSWYNAWQGAMMKTPAAFRARTRSLDAVLRASVGSFDVVLQVGGVFAPFRGEYPKPVTLFCDYTTKLAELNYSPWFGMSHNQAKHWYALETALYRSCSMIFTASENTKTSIVRDYGVRTSRVRVVGEGVHSLHEHPDKSYAESTVLFVGIDFERKGGPTLLRAFAKVKKALPRARLMIVGPGPRAAQEGVVWCGHVTDRNEIDRLFSKASVFAMPSRCEPFGLAVLEAMSHGLPVVVSSADAMPEIVQNGTTGYLVSPYDVDELAEALIALLSSPETCENMGNAGRDRVARSFLWQHVGNRIEHGLREACNGV